MRLNSRTQVSQILITREHEILPKGNREQLGLQNLMWFDFMAKWPVSLAALLVPLIDSCSSDLPASTFWIQEPFLSWKLTKMVPRLESLMTCSASLPVNTVSSNPPTHSSGSFNSNISLMSCYGHYSRVPNESHHLVTTFTYFLYFCIGSF